MADQKKNIQQNEGDGSILLNDINNSNININYNSASNEQKYHVNQQIYLKCDRQDTIEDLKDILEEVDVASYPVILFLPGFLEDEHNLAVRKMAHAIELEFDSPVAVIEAIDWNTHSSVEKQKKRLIRNVRESFELYLRNKGIKYEFPRVLENGKILTQYSVLRKHIVVYEQEIDLASWNNACRECLEFFLGKFWHFKIEKDQYPVFVVLSIIYGKQSKLKREQIENAIHQIRVLIDKFDSYELNILDELNELNRGHVKSFYDECGISDADYIIEEGKTMRMARLLQKLRDVLVEWQVKTDNQAIDEL